MKKKLQMVKSAHRPYLAFLLLIGINFSASAQWQNGLWTERQANNWYFC